MNLTDYLRSEIDQGKCCRMFLLDLQKAFDTFNHSILLYKLKAIGLGKSWINWMTAYLTDRMHVL